MIRIFRNFVSTLKRSSWASGLNIVGLSVAFAVFTVIYTQVRYEFSYDKSFPKSGRIYRLELNTPEFGYFAYVPVPCVNLIRTQIPELGRACYMALDDGERSFTVVGADGSKSFYKEKVGIADTGVVYLFDLEILAGDYRTALGVKDHVLLPLSVARKFFGEDTPLGRTFLVDGAREMTVAAVYRDVPDNSTLKNGVYSYSFSTGEGWGNHNYFSYYEIKPGTDLHLLQQKVYGLKELIAQAGEEDFFEKDGILFRPLCDVHFTPDRYMKSGDKTMTLLLLSIGILVLVIASVNFVNFSTALAPSRIKSLNTQKTFGATNYFLRSCVVSEAVLFSFVSYLLGIGWCYLLSGTVLQELVSVSLNPFNHLGVLFLVAGLSLLVGILAGLYPAFYMTSFQPALVLKGSQAMTPRGIFLRNSLVVFQFMISMILVIGTLFIWKQMDMVKGRPWGIDKDHVVYVALNQELVKQKDAFAEDLKSNAAITDVTYASDVLGNQNMDNWQFTGIVDGEEKAVSARISSVDPNYLDFFGIKVKEGKDSFAPTDTLVLVNEAFLREYSVKSPLAMKLLGANVTTVMNDFNFFSLQRKIEPLIISINNFSWTKYCYVRINDAARNEAISHIRKSVSRFAANYDPEVKFLDDHLQSYYQKEEREGKLISFCGIVAIIISLMGVYGLVLFNARFRAKEIGVRKVNGATSVQIIGMLNRGFIYLVLLAFLLACPLAWFGVSEWLNGFMYKTELSWWVFIVSGSIVLLITLCTISWQSWKAASLNPVDVLKSE